MMSVIKTMVKVPFASDNRHLQEELTIEDLFSCSENVIDKAVDLIEEAIYKADLSKEDIDLIVLAGGSSQLPGVKRKIREYLGKSPCEIPNNLMLAVSYGAALYHRDLFNLPKAKREKRILGENLGIYVDDDGRKTPKILLNHNTTLPAQTETSFSIAEHQERATIRLVMVGENGRHNRNLKGRDLVLSGNATEIRVKIEVDENRIITLSAYDPQNPKDVAIIKSDLSVGQEKIRERQQILGLLPMQKSTLTGIQDCIGIDLGTTTCELAYCNRTGDVQWEALLNPEPVGDRELAYAKYCFPSVVYYRDGFKQVEVANTDAVNAMNGDDRCFHTFKIKDKFRPVGTVAGEPITVRDLSAQLLNKIWNAAQTLAGPPTSAVITVPAAFSFDECQDTYNAAIMAGVGKVTLIDEPTAAFLYYKEVQGIDVDEIQNVLVFDFGGGTTDVAILDIRQGDGLDGIGYKDCVYRVLATAGNTQCGGRDIDKAIVELVCQRFEQKNGVQINATKMRALRRSVEAAKIYLSDAYWETELE